VSRLAAGKTTFDVIRSDRLVEPVEEKPYLITLVRSAEEEQRAHLLIESLRAFGGRLGNSPVWVFLPDPERVSTAFRKIEGVDFFPLVVEEEFRRYFFADKVYACARAEQMMESESRSLVWMSTGCLVLNPPILFHLSPPFEVALRPVHVKNIGSLANEPLDDFWSEIYRMIGIERAPFAVQSFVDLQELRPYFNTHAFSINPAKGLLRTWLEIFKAMVSNQEFQSGPCRDELHQIFLHQAILSALVVKLLDRDQIYLLPPDYGYPLHFQGQIPSPRRSPTLNSLVCPVYEEVPPHPNALKDIEVQEPLRSWMLNRVSSLGG
jgi:hypothetical protein